MEFTGEIYFYYTSKTIIDIYESLKKYANQIGYLYNLEVDNLEEYSLMFYKDDFMFEYHSENGYNVDLQGEGCFFIGIRKVTLDGRASLFELNGISNFEPTETCFVLSNVTYCQLIVPDYIEEDPFSLKVYTDFYRILKDYK